MVSSVSPSSLAYYQGQTALSLLTGSSNGVTTTSDALLSAYLAQQGTTAGASSASASGVPPAPTAPWSTPNGTPSTASAVQAAVSGAQLINPAAARLSAPGGVSSQDYKNLFALYQGLNTLYDLANTAVASGTASADPSLAHIPPSQLQAAFASGMSQVENFLSNAPFQGFNLTSGGVKASETSTVGVPNGTYQTYATGIIGTGDEAQPLAALQGNVQFTISVQSKYATVNQTQSNGTVKQVQAPPTVINIDLSNMGTAPRTIDNVVNYINSQLKAAKVSTTFAAANLGSTAKTTTLPNGQTINSPGVPEWGLRINGSAAETVSFSAPATAAAVYVSMGTGGAKTYSSKATVTDPATGQTTTGPGQTTTPTGEQLMKLQTTNSASGGTVTPPANAGDTSGLPAGAAFAKSLPDGVGNIEASTTGADGSVYLLADATGAVNSQPIQGGQGVALLKYDSSGKLLYTKIVAGLQNASGASIAVNTDGSVAVAGTNTTNAATASSGLTTPAATSAFVQVYDPTGAPSWKQTIPALAGASVANGVAFGANGAVFVSGTTNGSVGSQIPKGSTDQFIQGFDGTGAATFTKQFGATGGANTASGLAFDSTTNTLYAAGLQNSNAVVTGFTIATTGSGANTITKATSIGSRNLGFANSVAGIGLVNGQVVVGGTAGASTIKAGTVTSPYKGVSAGFVASISGSLTASSGDTVAYLGGSGQTQVATGFTVAGGQAYLTGTIANDAQSTAAANATEGFVQSVDPATGAITYTSKFPGANGQAAPQAIAVAASGSSILDQLGLPTGTVNAAQSNLITAATSIQPGQSFWVRTSPGGPQSQVTITATDTLTSLASKLNIALGGQGTAKVQSIGANSELSISPATSSSFIELDSQAAANLNPGATAPSLGNDVLAALGLQAGVIRTVRQVNGLTDITQLREYGLNLPTNLDLSNTAAAQHAANALQAAMSAVQSAYRDLANPPTMASEAAAAAQNQTGAVPTYLTNEIANLQAGLNRLTAGQGSGSGAAADPTLSLFGG